MKTRKCILALTVTLLAAALGYDAYIARKALASRDESAALARRYAQIVREIHLFGRQENPTGQDAALQDQAKATTSVGSGTKITNPAIPKPNARQLIASDPDLSRQYLKNYSSGLDVEYGLFIRMAGLSPADAAQFKQLMAEIEANNLQVFRTAAEEGLATNDPQMKALQAQLNQQDWIARANLLGPSAMAAFDQYRTEGSVVTLVQNFGGSLGDSTLNVDQARQLLSVLSDASARDSNGNVVPNSINFQQAMAASSSILNQDQAMVLSAMLQVIEAKTRLNQLTQGP
jgi:hypothetical protein